MTFTDFLKALQNKELWHSKHIFCFQAQQYPFFFFKKLFNYLEDNALLPAQLERISGEDLTTKKISSRINQSFLGNYSFLWLGSLESIATGKHFAAFVDDIVNYAGPNYVAFFVPSSISLKKASIITVGNTLTVADLQLLITLFAKDFHQHKIAFLHSIFKKTKSISLDSVCMILDYLELINIRYLDEAFVYITAHLEQEHSLMQLSEYFLSFQKTPFFMTWSGLRDLYPVPFWTSYWSDQIWRSYHVIELLKQKNFAQAKKMSFRLPYSFLQRNWKNVTLKHLSDLHKTIYVIDVKSKEGSTFHALDLFYSNHFGSKQKI